MVRGTDACNALPAIVANVDPSITNTTAICTAFAPLIGCNLSAPVTSPQTCSTCMEFVSTYSVLYKAGQDAAPPGGITQFCFDATSSDSPAR